MAAIWASCSKKTAQNTGRKNLTKLYIETAVTKRRENSG